MISVLIVITLVLGTPIAIQQKTATISPEHGCSTNKQAKGCRRSRLARTASRGRLVRIKKPSRSGSDGRRAAPEHREPGAYTLDGVERQSDSGGGPVVVTLRGLWAGPRLQLFRKQSVTGANPTETNALRTLELSADGKTLTVAMRYQGSRGATESKWVFGR